MRVFGIVAFSLPSVLLLGRHEELTQKYAQKYAPYYSINVFGRKLVV